MVQAKISEVSLAVLFCFYTILIFSINPFLDEFHGMSYEVTDQNEEGVFSSLSRNFEQTIEEIKSGDEKSTTSTSTDTSNSGDEKSTTSTSTDTSNSGDEKSSTADVPITASEPSNPISTNSTKTDDLAKKNQSDFNK
ncbi:hypothetical protein [Candidatus Nitrosocosmicus arcticus]|uniref:Uncharacterized protein n=1 Tax=Candidatus Nitrosocosmicus arcticus TaxID=2035267 RepID=A0A557ST97_9ARCH|nr:hypothetical protein [Candidatus Nitrosocosmicus arcticus]TVP39808.1 hypothetical protein NARC_110019 [Candidatus Nitrosocosmicus arcticus]